MTNTPARTFEGLRGLHSLRPISDDVDFENAQEIAASLAVLDRRTLGQDEYLESLSVLMEHYEETRSPVDTNDLTPIELLNYLMESHEMTASELGRLLSERSLVRNIGPHPESHRRDACATTSAAMKEEESMPSAAWDSVSISRSQPPDLRQPSGLSGERSFASLKDDGTALALEGSPQVVTFLDDRH